MDILSFFIVPLVLLHDVGGIVFHGFRGWRGASLMVDYLPLPALMHEDVCRYQDSLIQNLVANDAGKAAKHPDRRILAGYIGGRRIIKNGFQAFHHLIAAQKRFPTGMNAGNGRFFGPNVFHGVKVPVSESQIEGIIGKKNGGMFRHWFGHSLKIKKQSSAVTYLMAINQKDSKRKMRENA
jgi:hypothetical protein